MARLVVLEGPDGIGKTTLAHALVEALNDEAEPAAYRSSPGEEPGTLGKLVHDIHHDPGRVGITRDLNPASLQLLHVAAHLDAMQGGVLTPLSHGISVILDRFWWSTWVYGMASGLDESLLKMMIEIELSLWGSLKPDGVILVSRAPETAEQKQLWPWYERLAEEEKSSYPVHRLVNNSSVNEAVAAVRALIPEWSRR